MYCPRCGAEYEEGARYCASCGHGLPDNEAPASASASADAEDDGGLRGSLGRLVGRDRRTRLLTVGTVLALLVALVAFLALDSGEEDEEAVPQDAYTRALDEACVQHKGEIAAAQAEALKQKGAFVSAGYAEAFVPIVGAWRSELDGSAIPSDRTELVGDLQGALLEVQIEAGTFARALREGNKGELVTAAGDLEAATENVEAAIVSLELQRCSHLRISQGKLVGQ